jgi:uncharacterized protein (DUF736 family)
MIIGNFTKTRKGFEGTIETLLFTVTDAVLEPVSDKPTRKSPDLKIMAGNREIGAAWKKTSRDNGKEYFSVLIEDPTVSIHCVLFPTEAGGYVLIWNRPRD